MRTGRCLFGNPGKGPLAALHFPLGEPRRVALARHQIGILLSRRGTGPESGAGGEFISPENHEGVLILFDRSLLATLLDPFRPGLDPLLRDLIGKEVGSGIFAPDLSTDIAARLYSDFLSPGLQGAAQWFFFEAKTRELLAHVAFVPSGDRREFFCSRQRRLNSERVARTVEYLKARLDEPLDLGTVADWVGCSPSYLSRIFSATTGFTISQFIRKTRIEKAAALLVTGNYSVSEVAVEVGYQSLSHFSKAFQAEKGCSPSRYEAA